jgi:hypothetical protein
MAGENDTPREMGSPFANDRGGAGTGVPITLHDASIRRDMHAALQNVNIAAQTLLQPSRSMQHVGRQKKYG